MDPTSSSASTTRDRRTEPNVDPADMLVVGRSRLRNNLTPVSRVTPGGHMQVLIRNLDNEPLKKNVFYYCIFLICEACNLYAPHCA